MVERTRIRLQEIYRRYYERQARFWSLQRTSEQVMADALERLVRATRPPGQSPPIRR